MFFGRNDAKAETLVLWPPHVKSWLIGKDSDAGSDWGQEEKGTTEDEMAGWHHWLNGRESEWTPGDGDRQGGLVCWDSWIHEESDTTERLNWTLTSRWENWSSKQDNNLLRLNQVSGRVLIIESMASSLSLASLLFIFIPIVQESHYVKSSS